MRRAFLVALILGCTGCGVLPRSHFPDFVRELPLCTDAQQERYEGAYSARDCTVYFGGSSGFSNIETMLHVRFTTEPDGVGSIVVDRYSGNSDRVDRNLVVETGLLAFDYPLYVRGTGFADFYPLTRRDGVPVLSVWVYASEENPRVHAGDVPGGSVVNLGDEIYAVTSNHAPGPWTWQIFEVESHEIVDIGTAVAHVADSSGGECVVGARFDVQRSRLELGDLQVALCGGIADQSPRWFRDNEDQDPRAPSL